MNWLARLKSEKAQGTHATKPTKPGFVGFVASPHGPFQKIEAIAGACVTDAETGAKNQNAPSMDATKATKPGFVGFVASDLGGAQKLGPVDNFDTARGQTCRDCQRLTPAGTCADPVGAGLRQRFGIVWPEPTRAATCKAFVERQRPATAPEAPILTPEQRRRLWWGQPASAEELERMAARVARGERLGLSAREADAAADVLHLRDRDRDDRHLCLECQHVRADRAGWRCAALRGPIPSAWVTRQLQRCNKFKGVNRD
jgi:hypothetical protein